MPDQKTHSADVAVLGCGMMGAALVRTFAAQGLRVTAWNRTFARAEGLQSGSVTAIADIGEAVASVPLIVGCTDSLESLRAALEPVQDWNGATLANLVTNSESQEEEFAAWVAGRGGRYLGGMIVAYPEEVGTDASFFTYAGPEELWTEHGAVLSVLGPHTFTPGTVGLASVVFAGDTGFYVPAMAGFVSAVTYLKSHGIPRDAILASTERVMDMIRRHLDEGIEAILSGKHETDQATVDIFAKGIRERIPQMQAEGRSTRIQEAILGNLDAAIAAGYGDEDFYAQSKVV